MQTHKNKSLQITNSIVMLPTRLGIILIIIITSFLAQKQIVHTQTDSINSAVNLELKSGNKTTFPKTLVLLNNKPAVVVATPTGITSPSNSALFSKVNPSNRVTQQLVNPTLSLKASSGLLRSKYCIDTNNNNTCDSSWISANTNTSTPIKGLEAGRYYWQVRSRDTNGIAYANEDSTTSWRSFTILPTPTWTSTFSAIVSPTSKGEKSNIDLVLSMAEAGPSSNILFIPLLMAKGNSYYVDNAATGANNGTSWTDAWKSFAAITWSSIKAGSTLYISGGSSSQTYNEILNIGASGSAGNFITIDVGANSPAPLGHSGTVIINGGGVREKGIEVNTKSYIHINGYDKSGHYRLQVQNVLGLNGGDPCIYIYNSNYIYVDYVKVIANTSRGIYFNTCKYCRLRGSDSETGIIDLAVQTDPLFISQGTDNIVENNILIQGNRDSAKLHIDPIITNGETRLIIRNNWIECMKGLVDINENAFLIENIHDRLDFYNNVVIGSDTDAEKVGMFLQTAEPTALYYIWNNTFITKNPHGGVLEFFNWTNDQLGALKNNIFYSPNGILIVTNWTTFSPSSKIDNNCFYRASGSIVFSNMKTVNRTWAQWQASGYDARGINQNPLLDGNYRLQSSSPCIGAGVDLSFYFKTDKDGVTRRVGAWDQGAYQYIAQ